MCEFQDAFVYTGIVASAIASLFVLADLIVDIVWSNLPTKGLVRPVGRHRRVFKGSRLTVMSAHRVSLGAHCQSGWISHAVRDRRCSV